MARAVEREDVSAAVVRATVLRIINEPAFTVRDAYAESVELAERDHNLEMATRRITGTLASLPEAGAISDTARSALLELRDAINEIIQD